MKKFTKILSLALALALVLGMTAFADTPSRIVYTDDFDETTIAAFKAGGTAVSTVISGKDRFVNNDTFTETLTPSTRYYDSPLESETTNGYEMEVVNGKGGIQRYVESSSNIWNNNLRQIAYTFPETWTTNEKNYALVSQMGWDILQVAGTASSGSYGHDTNALSGVILTTKNSEGVETTGTKGTMGYRTEYSTSKVNMYPNNQTDIANDFYEIPDYTYGQSKAASLYTVVRPSTIEEEGTESLNVITYANRKAIAKSSYRVTDYNPISKVHGVFYNWQGYVRSRFEDFKMYKVSLDPADFTITSSTALSDVNLNDGVDVTFSQPISITTSTMQDLLAAITITPEGGEALAYGENYTISVAEKTSGTSIYDVLTITPTGTWQYGTKYTVGLPKGMMNIASVEMADKTDDVATVATITFTTEAAPAFSISLTAAEGLTTGTAINTVADLAGKTVYFTANATKTAGKTTGGVVAIGIYDKDDNLVKYAYAEKTFDSVGSANTFSAAFKVAEGQTAKAFVKGVDASVKVFGE